MITASKTLERTETQSLYGTSGFAAYGRFGEGYTTHENRHFIQGKRVSWYRKARFMCKEPTVNFLMLMFVGRMMANEHEIEQDEDTPEEIVDLVRDVVKTNWDAFLKPSAFGCCKFGWQPFEQVYKLKDGYHVIDKVKPLLQDMTRILEARNTGEFLGFSQGNETLRIEDGGISLFNFLPEAGYHYGTAPLKALETTFDRQTELYRQVRKYDERLASTHWAIYYPIGRTKIDPTISDAESTSSNYIDNFEMAKKIMNTLIQTGSIVIPSSIDEAMGRLNEIGASQKGPWRVEVLSNGEGAGQAPYSDRLKYYDTLFARGLGFPERSVFEGQHGTKAESETQGDMASTISDLFFSEICRGWNETTVPDIIESNFGHRYAKSVRVKPNSIKMDEKAFFRQLYERILNDPELLLIEAEHIDMTALRERIGVPVDIDVDEEEVEERIRIASQEKDEPENDNSNDPDNPAITLGE